MTERGMITEMTLLALLTAWNVHRPSEGICAPELRGKFDTTDRPPVYPAAHRGQVCGWVGWRSGLKYSAGER